jgi:hypothetical protein
MNSEFIGLLSKCNRIITPKKALVSAELAIAFFDNSPERKIRRIVNSQLTDVSAWRVYDNGELWLTSPRLRPWEFDILSATSLPAAQLDLGRGCLNGQNS